MNYTDSSAIKTSDYERSLMRAIAHRCMSLSGEYDWLYGGTKRYFADLLSAECMRSFVVASDIAYGENRPFDERSYVQSWSLPVGSTGEKGAYERLHAIAAKLHEVEGLVTGVSRQLFPSKDIVDLECSGDLHKDSFSLSLTMSDNSHFYFKANGAANMEFASEALDYLKENTGLGDRDWFELPDFYVVDGHLLTRDVRESSQQEGDLESWYRKAGSLLAFATLTGLTDLHVENLISVGKSLFLIDVDTLFHDRIQQPEYPNEAFSVVDRLLFNSIMSTGLIPLNLTKAGKRLEYGDIAGFTSTSVSYSTTFLVCDYFKNQKGLRRWRLETRTLPPQKTRNLPMDIEDGKKSIREHSNHLCATFIHILNWAKDNLRIYKSFLREHAMKVDVRCLVRNTASYTPLMALASSPMEESRRRAENALRRHSKGIDPRIVDSEIKQISAGFVPTFRWKAAEIPYGLSRTPLDSLCDRLTVDFLGLQEQLLDFFLAEQKAMTVGGDPFSSLLESVEDCDISRENLIEQVVQKLIDEAYYSSVDHSVSYATLTVDTSDELAVVAMGADPYSGLAGIALVVEEIEEIHPGLIPSWFRSAVRKSASSFVEPNGSKGFYECSFAQLRHVYSNPSDFMGRFGSLAGDFLAGLPGLSLWLPSELRSEQRWMLDEIIESLDKNMDGSLSWNVQDDDPPASFAHGNSGLIYTLSRWRRCLHGDLSQLDDAIEKLLRYEVEHLPQETKGVYVDSRTKEGASANWCHSVPGMLISRCEVISNTSLMRELPEGLAHVIRQEASNQVAWLDENWGDTLSYGNCHGVAGNLAILRWAAQSLGISTKTDFRDSFSRLLAWGSQTHWGNTVKYPVCNASLMNGLWGVVYSALYSCQERVSRPPLWAVAFEGKAGYDFNTAE